MSLCLARNRAVTWISGQRFYCNAWGGQKCLGVVQAFPEYANGDDTTTRRCRTVTEHFGPQFLSFKIRDKILYCLRQAMRFVSLVSRPLHVKYRVTILLVQNLPLTLIWKLRFSIRSLFWNTTFKSMSTGCFEQADWSPSRHLTESKNVSRAVYKTKLKGKIKANNFSIELPPRTAWPSGSSTRMGARSGPATRSAGTVP